MILKRLLRFLLLRRKSCNDRKEKSELWLKTSIWTGMKPWRAPQSSEHWPEKVPVSSHSNLVVEILPGIASSFRPVVGTAIAWMTSTAEITKREKPEIVTRFDAIRPRRSPILRKETSVMSRFWEIQYHCKPTKSKHEAELGLFTESTSWLRAKTPMVGVKRARDSILREAELWDVFVKEWFCNSDVETMRADTAAKRPKRNPQRMEQALKIERIRLRVRWPVFVI